MKKAAASGTEGTPKKTPSRKTPARKTPAKKTPAKKRKLDEGVEGASEPTVKDEAKDDDEVRSPLAPSMGEKQG